MINASLRCCCLFFLPVLQYKKSELLYVLHIHVCVVLLFNKMAAALLWDSKHTFSSGTCRALATVRGRYQGDRDCCNGHQRWLAGNLWCWGEKKRNTLSGIWKGTCCCCCCCWERFFFYPPPLPKTCKLVVFGMTLLIAARRFDIRKNQRRVLQVNASGKNTRSKHRQITSPGSVFFLSCWRQEMQTKDRLWEGTHYLLRNSGFASAPFTRPGLFSDLWGKWILERPAAILQKVFPFSRGALWAFLTSSFLTPAWKHSSMSSTKAAAPAADDYIGR